MSTTIPPQAFIFDMDGLLLDSERLAFAIGRETCLALDLPWSEEAALGMIGLNAASCAAWLRQCFGNDYPVEAQRAEFGRRYEAHVTEHGVPLKPGVLELLDRLDALAIPRAVATSTASNRARLKLDRTGLAHRFDHIVGGDQVERGKPAPDIFLAAAKALAIAPEACLALEDSNAGGRAALAAGMSLRVIPDLLAPAPELAAAGAKICTSLFDVLAELE
ncbi:HAD family hydrolase [Niveibacterium terrae]|uniref:HAD family hydrolase n=1 Tax=Niveibacterium terrae TaxID=3373598 RepID=UPI003A8F5DAA